MPVAGGASGEREASTAQRCSCTRMRAAVWCAPEQRLVPTSQACKTEACAIQTCLSKSHYQSEKCQEQIQSLMKCCEKYQVRG